MLAKVCSAAMNGIEACPVDVEVDSGFSDSYMVIVGLPDAAVQESRDIEGAGKWMTDGGETPQDMVDAPAQQFVNSLFRRIEKPSVLW